MAGRMRRALALVLVALAVLVVLNVLVLPGLVPDPTAASASAGDAPAAASGATVAVWLDGAPSAAASTGLLAALNASDAAAAPSVRRVLFVSSAREPDVCGHVRDALGLRRPRWTVLCARPYAPWTAAEVVRQASGLASGGGGGGGVVLLLSGRVGLMQPSDDDDHDDGGLLRAIAAAAHGLTHSGAVLGAPLLVRAGSSVVQSAGVLVARAAMSVRADGREVARGNTFVPVPRLAGVDRTSSAVAVGAAVTTVTADAVLFLSGWYGALDDDAKLLLAPLDRDAFWAAAAASTLRHGDVRYMPQLALAVDESVELQPGAGTSQEAQEWLAMLHATSHKCDVAVVWDGYLNDCTGWASEAISFLVELEQHLRFLAIVADDSFCPGYPAWVRDALHRLRTVTLPDEIDVWVSHKPPPSYPRFPYNGLRRVERRPRVVVGRSMIESVDMPAAWRGHSERVDEVWVPSSFLLDVFVRGGVPPSKLVLVPEAVDVHLFDPSRTAPLALPQRRAFNFLSIFKWEERKGYDVLLQAYASAFTADDDVCLYLHTYLYAGATAAERRNSTHLHGLAVTAMRAHDPAVPPERLPCVAVLTDLLPRGDMPRLYRAADAFVLPTRGEGWGLPLMEAMAMGLPTVATNFSGQLDFLDERTGYLIAVEAMEPPSSAAYDPALRWARASWQHLAQLMRAIVAVPSAAAARGAAARRRVVEGFNEARVARTIAERLVQLKGQR